MLYLPASGQTYFANTRKIGVEEGLSHYRVLSFLSAEKGMWIGTEDGLNFYDGYNWKQWSKDDNQLLNKAVNFIHQDQSGILWLFNTKSDGRTNNVQSINLLSPEIDSMSNVNDHFGDQFPFAIEHINHFFSGPNHQLFFNVNGQTWSYTKENQFEIADFPASFVPNSILNDGTFAGNLDGRLALVNANKALIYHSDYLLKPHPFQIIGNSDNFWVWQAGALCKNFKQSSDRSYRNMDFPLQGTNPEDLRLLSIDPFREGFWVHKGQRIYLYNFDNDLVFEHDTQVRVASLDRNGNLWTGKHEIELLQLQAQEFKHYLYTESRSDLQNDAFQCRGILKIGDLLYVNTYQGPKIIDLNSGLIKSEIQTPFRTFTQFQDHQSNIWLAHREIYKLDESGFKVAQRYLTRDQGSPRIWSMFEDQSHRIWFGHVGLSFFKNGKLQRFNQYNGFESLQKALILFFFQDKNGVIWLGTNEGLYQFDPEKGILDHFGKNKKGRNWLPSSKFQHMYQDDDGIFWLATEDTGLIRWDRASGKVDQFNKANGMPNNNFYSVYEDDFGALWLSSVSGIIRFDKTSGKIDVYHEEDGITCNEFNRISHFQAKDGTIYFGSQNGVTSFHPKDFKDGKLNPYPKELVIEHVSVLGKRIIHDTLANGKPIDLQHLASNTRVIDFELSIEDIFPTDKTDFYYTLEQNDFQSKANQTSKEYISSDNRIQLFGLHPGKYKVLIKAVQKNGQLIAAPLEIPITITKPFYHTAWFWIALILLLSLSIWVYTRFRENQLIKRQAELEKLAAKRAEQIILDQKLIATQAKQIEDMQYQLNRKDALWLEQFKTVVNDRLADPDLYLPAIIEDMDISRSVFYEKVKALTQMTPNQYIQELRLSRAKALLDEGKAKTVKAAASAVGINRPSYFSKLFKDRFGILPSTYFRDHKN